LNVVVICPGLVFGPVLPPKVSGSITLFMYILKGLYQPSSNLHLLETKFTGFLIGFLELCTPPGIQVPMDHLYIGCVDVRDVAMGMILLYENSTVKGRHFCEEAITRFSDLVNKICDLYPEYQVKR
jgi:nucleoside-diphosphate-sugar epimerase